MASSPLFVDTNLFLRYLTNDLPEQAAAFEKILHRAAAGDLHLVTSSLVIAEIVWTLESYFHLSRDQVRRSLLAILSTPGLEIDQAGLAMQAVTWYAEKNVDYIDAYNAAWMSDHNLASILTLDKKHFSRLGALQIVDPQSISE